jgi:hypothetical protein
MIAAGVVVVDQANIINSIDRLSLLASGRPCLMQGRLARLAPCGVSGG